MRSQRDIDLAHVLEDVSGVLGVYAVRGAPGVEHAIHLAHGEQFVAAAHYAMLRVLTHAECATVVLCHELPAFVRTSATRITLSPG